MQPDTGQHQAVEECGASGGLEFPVKAPHAAVLVPFHPDRPAAAARALAMADACLGFEQDLQAGIVDALAEVQILRVKKIAFIPTTDQIESGPGQEHAGA